MSTTYSLANASLELLRAKTLYVAALSAVSNFKTPTYTEVSNTGAYARQPITFGAAVNGSMVNNVVVNFPQATAAWSAPVTHLAIVDSATYGAGTVWHIVALSASQTVALGNQLAFDTTTNTITVNCD